MSQIHDVVGEFDASLHGRSAACRARYDILGGAGAAPTETPFANNIIHPLSTW
jgi:hypothetical protein